MMRESVAMIQNISRLCILFSNFLLLFSLCFCFFLNTKEKGKLYPPLSTTLLRWDAFIQESSAMIIHHPWTGDTSHARETLPHLRKEKEERLSLLQKDGPASYASMMSTKTFYRAPAVGTRFTPAASSCGLGRGMRARYARRGKSIEKTKLHFFLLEIETKKTGKKENGYPTT